jgi:tRNA-splicing ligase RtcB
MVACSSWAKPHCRGACRRTIVGNKQAMQRPAPVAPGRRDERHLELSRRTERRGACGRATGPIGAGDAHGLAAHFRPRRRDHKDGRAPRAGVAVDGRLAVARGDAGAAILEFARESDLIACRSGQTCPRARPGALLSHALKPWGQPVLTGGSMGTSSFVLTGAPESEAHAFASACHGAGRMMSRH